MGSYLISEGTSINLQYQQNDKSVCFNKYWSCGKMQIRYKYWIKDSGSIAKDFPTWHWIQCTGGGNKCIQILSDC